MLPSTPFNELLLQKLGPLMPDRVRLWRLALERSSASTRPLVERQIVRTARDVFGNQRLEALLSLPPRSQSSGTFDLGQILYEKPKWRFRLRSDELLQNVVVLGRSGSGKTNFTFHMLRQLIENRIGVLFFDWKRTARHFLPLLPRGHGVQVYTPGRGLVPLPFNPFLAPPNVEPSTYVQQVVDVFAEAYTLGDGARTVLLRAFENASSEGVPDLTSVLKAARALPDAGRAGAWKVSALRALESVAFAGLGTGDAAGQQRFVQDLLSSVTVLELDGLAHGAKRFLVPLLCLWLYAVRLAASNREELRFVIVVEEAHHVLYGGGRRAGETTLEMLLRQGRELGLSFVVIDQHPSLLSPAALGNTYTTVCLNLKDPTDVRKASGLTGLSTSQSSVLTHLPVGEAVVRLQDRWTQPVRIRIPHVEIPKGTVTDERLAALSGASSTLSTRTRAVQRESWRCGRSTGSVPRLSAADRALIADVVSYPTDGVDARYRRLQWSATKGTTVKRSLVARGVLKEAVVPRGRTRRHVLAVPTDVVSRVSTAESVEHDHWKREWSRILRDQGFQVRVEAPRPAGGFVDVLGQGKRGQVAIEVETGKSDVVANVRRCLLSGFDVVVVVATNRRALRRVERQLATAGLLVPPRVQLVVQDANSRLSGFAGERKT